MRILFAISSILMGIALLTGGYRVARVTIPLWGILTSILIGEAVVRVLIEAPLIALLWGFAAALAFGFIFCLAAASFYFLAVLVLYGSLGYWLGESMALSLGFPAVLLWGMGGFLFGVGIGGCLLYIKTDTKTCIIVGTSFAAAVAIIGGILLLFNQVNLFTGQDIQYLSITSSFLSIIAVIAVTLVGILVQDRLTQHFELAPWRAND